MNGNNQCPQSARNLSHWKKQARMTSAFLSGFDYEAQLAAIRNLLNAHYKLSDASESEIQKARQHAEESSGFHSEYAENAWSDQCYDSVYQDAAHSMAAVGALAPLLESLFFAVFQGIRKYREPGIYESTDERWSQSQDDAWDCHYFWEKGQRRRGIVKGINQLSAACDLKRYMPEDLEKVLNAIFAYRNAMFHCGYEWPPRELEKFERSKSFCSDWFDSVKIDKEIKFFYMSRLFIEHCIDIIENVFEGLIKYSEHYCENSGKGIHATFQCGKSS